MSFPHSTAAVKAILPPPLRRLNLPARSPGQAEHETALLVGTPRCQAPQRAGQFPSPVRRSRGLARPHRQSSGGGAPPPPLICACPWSFLAGWSRRALASAVHAHPVPIIVLIE